MKCSALACLLALAAATPGFAALPISVENFSFEDPGTGKQDLTLVPGWDAESGTLGVENLGSGGHYAPAVTDGSYNLYAGGNSWAIQTTAHTIAAGEVFQLTVDVSNTYKATQGGTIELYYDDGGTLTTLGATTHDFPAGNTSGPFEVTLSVSANDIPASVGKNIGIRLGTTDAWVGFDNVRLGIVTDIYWDGDDTTADADGGPGTWDVGTTANWDKAPTGGIAIVWSQGGDAVFGGTAGGIVTLDEPVTANSLAFDLAGYDVTADTLTLGGATPVIETNQDATISSALAGTSGFAKTGDGTLNLSGDASGLTGTLTIDDGRLNLSGALGASVMVEDTGTLGGESSITDLTFGTSDGATIAADTDTSAALSAGTLTVNGTTNILLEGTVALDTAHTVLNYTSFPVGTVDDFVVSGGFGRTVVSDTGSAITVTVSAAEASSFTAATSDNWEVGGPDENWNSTDAFFFNGDNVTFDDTVDALFGGAVTVSGNPEPASISFNNSATVSYTLEGGAIGGTGGLTMNGSGDVFLNNNNAYSGSLVVNDGRLEINNWVHSVADFTVNGPGTLVTSATNIFVLGHGIPLPDTMVITVNNGTWLCDAQHDARIGSVTLTNGGTWSSDRGLGGWDCLLANVVSGPATVTVDGTGAAIMNGTGGIHLQGVQNFVVADTTGDSGEDLIVSMILDGPGNIAGDPGGIHKTGAGTMSLTGVNTYTGATIVSGGVLAVNGTSLDDTDPDLDFENDGLESGIEWVVGGDPTANDAAGVTPSFDNASDPDDFLFSYRRSDEANADMNTTIIVEYGSDLTGWTTAEDGINGVSIDDSTDLGGGFHSVTVSIPRALATDAKFFARLNVVVVTP